MTSTLIGYVLGLPLGILLVVTSQDGISPRPGLNRVLSVIVNLFRSVPFLILLVCVLGFTRLLVGTTIGSHRPVIPPLVIAAAPYVGRMVEGALKEVDHRGDRSRPEHGRHQLADHHPGAAAGELAFPAQRRHHRHHHHPELFRHGGRFGGRRPGGPCAINYGYYRYQEDVMWVAVVLLVIPGADLPGGRRKLTWFR